MIFDMTSLVGRAKAIKVDFNLRLMVVEIEVGHQDKQDWLVVRWEFWVMTFELSLTFMNFIICHYFWLFWTIL